MNGLNIDTDAFHMAANVPENLVGEPADGDWAAWHGVTSVDVDGRLAVVLVSITITAFRPQKPAGEALLARLRARHPDGAVRIEQFTTQGGDPAVTVRRVATQRVGDKDVATGQAQALVAYLGAGALGVVSAVALDPGVLDRAADLVTGIAAGMTVTAASAAA